MLIGATFRDVYNRDLKDPIFGSQSKKIMVFGNFLNKLSLVSHQYCFNTLILTTFIGV